MWLPLQLSTTPGRGSSLAGDAVGTEPFGKALQLFSLDALTCGGEAPLRPHALAAREWHSEGEAGPGSLAELLTRPVVEEAGAVREIGKLAQFEAVDPVHLLGMAGEHLERSPATERADAGHHGTAGCLDRRGENTAGNPGGRPSAKNLGSQR